ncbi:hypothetical protein QVD17_29853 [Tagetes erecta]|uniref:Uncharacterized protein n=1 Tax=Tagetes erecta TaxID=13708 RepID=A0AAD8K0T5_TARER|nr:hypothetical protein QVD17_29853 [Tagetes erecta]
MTDNCFHLSCLGNVLILHLYCQMLPSNSLFLIHRHVSSFVMPCCTKDVLVGIRLIRARHAKMFALIVTQLEHLWTWLRVGSSLFIK